MPKGREGKSEHTHHVKTDKNNSATKIAPLEAIDFPQSFDGRADENKTPKNPKKTTQHPSSIGNISFNFIVKTII